MNDVRRTEYGWIGYFCVAADCMFRRSTLLEYKDVKIIVFTIGDYIHGHNVSEIDSGTYYETKVLYVDQENVNNSYYVPDINKPIKTKCPSTISEMNKAMEANKMHEDIVEEIECRLENEEFTIENEIYNDALDAITDLICAYDCPSGSQSCFDCGRKMKMFDFVDKQAKILTDEILRLKNYK